MLSGHVQRSTARTAEAVNAPGSATGTGAHKVNDLSAPFYTAEEILPYLTAEEIRHLRQEVLTTINNELVHAEDLEVVVPRLLQSCVTEAKELRRAMNSMTSAQIVETQRARQIVQESHRRVQELRELFLKQGTIIEGMDVGTVSYSQLRQLHYLRENVHAVIEWSTALREVRFGNLYLHVEQRQFQNVYDLLTKLQGIRRTIVSQSGGQYRTYEAVFQPYFVKLDAVLGYFVETLYTLLSEDAMIIAIQRALEDDPSEDASGVATPESADFTALRECIAVCELEFTNPLLTYSADGAAEESGINVERVFAAITKNVSKLWDEQIMVEVTDPYSQVSSYLDQIKKVEPILEALELTLFPLSTVFSFFGFVVRAVHGEVMNVIEMYVQPDAPVSNANALMQVAQFLHWYKEMLTTFSYVRYVDISGIDKLSGALLTSAVGDLSSHLSRLCRACAITVCTEPGSISLLPSGHPVSTGPVDMYTVLQQTLGGLTTSVDRSVMGQIGRACANAIYSYLEECRVRSDFDYWEDENTATAAASGPLPPEEWQQQRLLTLYAFCNDCTTVENNLDTIELKFAMYWDPDGTSGEDASPFLRVQDALPDHAHYYLDEITAQVERVVADQWARVFRLGDWYDNDANPTLLIISTISEYIDEEFSSMLPEQRVRRITRQMLARHITKYLTTLMEFLAEAIRKPKKVYVEDWNAFLDCINRDIEVTIAMWRTRITDTRTRIIDIAQEALTLVKNLLSVKKAVDFGFLIQASVLDNFGDCPTFVIRFCLDARVKDVDKETRGRILAMWAEQVTYQHRDADDVPTTGWTQPPSLFGALDRSLAQLEKPAGLFGTSVKKRVAAEKQRQVATTKEAKRAARKIRYDADVAATRARKQPQVPLSKRDGDGEPAVEVTSLADVLK